VSVPVGDDTELRGLFRSEIAERAEALSSGARSFGAGTGSEALAADLFREGHTVKGTARMMGYTALSDAGRLLEEVWRGAHEGRATVAPDLAALLERVADALLPAVDADPETGTSALAEAAAGLRSALSGEPAGGQAAAPEPPGSAAEPETPRDPIRQSSDLDGLLAAIDNWGFGESVRVNAASLFRFINEISALRVDTESLGASAEALAGWSGDPHEFEGRLGELVTLARSTEKAIGELQERAVDLAAGPVSEITGTFPQLVRYLARKCDKEVRFELVGDHLTIDRQILERIAEPLRLLLVNAVHHGIESPQERLAAGKPPTGTIALRFTAGEHRLEIGIEDDGRGIDWRAVERAARRKGLLEGDAVVDREMLYGLLFSPRFSTVAPGDLVGDGDGLSNVAEAVESVHGTVRLESEPGRGVRVQLTLPASRSLQDAVLISAAGQTWGIPAIAVLARFPADPILPPGYGGGEIEWEGSEIPAISFARAVGLVEGEPLTRVLVVSHPAGPVAFLVSGELGRRQVAAREIGPVLGGVPHLTGAALLGRGNIVVLVDPARLAERVRAVSSTDGRPMPRVLVVDDSQGARQIVGGALGSAGFWVEQAAGAEEALALVVAHDFDALVVDFVLPVMDGAALVRRIRAIDPAVPIVVLSGLATDRDKARALEAGADACLDKDDVRKGALAEALSGLVSRRAS